MLSTPYSVFSANSVSSSGAFPARSPMPLTDTCTVSTPSATAASVFATPRSKSLWKCVSRGLLIRSFTLRAMNAAAGGDSTPNVSTSTRPSMCPSRSIVWMRSRNSLIPALVESMGKKMISRPFS